MNVQNIKIRNEEKENVDAFGNWLKVRTISVFGNVREHFKQIRVQQVLAENNRNHSIKAPKHEAGYSEQLIACRKTQPGFVPPDGLKPEVIQFQINCFYREPKQRAANSPLNFLRYRLTQKKGERLLLAVEDCLLVGFDGGLLSG
jgi:hypothetical protein